MRVVVLLAGIGWTVLHSASFTAFGSSYPTIESSGPRLVHRQRDEGGIYAWTAAFAAFALTVFGESGFLAPGGAMNLYVGGVIGMAWVIGVIVWGYGNLGSPDVTGDIENV